MSASLASRDLVRRALVPTARAIRRNLLPRVLPRKAHAFPADVKHVRVVGLLSSSSGLGKSARLCMDVLAEAGYAVSGVDVADLFQSGDGVPFRGPAVDAGPAQLSFYHLNPTMLLPGIIRSNPLSFLRTYNIAYWAWELEQLPAEWIAAIPFVDAIMVPSAFSKAAIEPHTSKPVLVVPHPLPVERAAERQVEAASSRFRVVSIFNFGSSFQRKNPLAAVRAFRQAFGDGSDAELILKVSDGHRYAADRSRLEAEIGSSANIRLIDEIWAEDRLRTLLRSADAYISLHRSEGFGLTIAEAILEGVPVVATNWSGNTDFCPPDLCFPVDYTLVPFDDDHSAFSGIGQARWAEASVDHAAAQLARVRDNPEAARGAADKLRERFAAYLSESTYRNALARLATGEMGQAVVNAGAADPVRAA